MSSPFSRKFRAVSGVLGLAARISTGQEALVEGSFTEDRRLVRAVFLNDPLTTCSLEDGLLLYREIAEGTKAYLIGLGAVRQLQRCPSVRRASSRRRAARSTAPYR